MGVDEFAAEEIVTLANFRTFWQAMQVSDPEQYPAELSEEDWAEQFAAWKEHNLR